MNLILITIDCLRANHLSCLGCSRKTTPNLDSLASAGLLFHQAISVGPSTFTSCIAIHTSTYPLMRGGELYITDSRLTLARVLKEHGYHTAAFHSNPWVSSYYNYHKGFDTFDDGIKRWKAVEKPRALVKQTSWTGKVLTPLAQLYLMVMAPRLYGNLFSNAQTLNRKAISWLQKNPSNFFLWIHYMDTHEPYLPIAGAGLLKSYHIMELDKRARNFPSGLSPNELSELINTYDLKISYVDKMIGSLLQTLEQNGILQNTFIIVTADHGQEFMEHGLYGHHSSHLYDELTRVPLIIVGPGLTSTEFEQQVSQIDLAPTVLDALHVGKPKAFVGDSLLGTMAKVEAITEADTRIWQRDILQIRPKLSMNRRKISLRTNKWKYIYTEGGQDELYDLENDPREKRNILDIEPEVTIELRGKLTAHMEFEQSNTRYYEEERIKRKARKVTARCG